VSDGLADGRVVSGVGGQYNFVAMAHALPDARSVLLLRATRDSGGSTNSNVVWNYGHCTIPRHLRDVYVTEHGIADLRGRSDEDCVLAMAAVGDARFQRRLLEDAKRHLKLRRDFAAPEAWCRNTPQRLKAALAPYRADGTLPDYPLGSDFSEVEQRLVKALGWLKANTGSSWTKARTVLGSLFAGRTPDREALARMRLDQPDGFGEKLLTRLLAYALNSTRGP
jgi:hypothetical protein